MSINNIQTFSGDVEMLSGNVFAKRLFVEDAITELGSNNQSYDHVGLLLTRQAGEYANIAIFYDDTAGQDTLKIGYTTNIGTDDTITLASSNLVTNIAGNVEAQFFIGNGSQLEGLVTDLQSVTDGGNSTSNNLLLTSEGTAINVSAGNVFVNNYITASRFYGDGAYLTNIAANFEEIIINGNVTNNVVELRNATSLVTTGSVGISNLQPNENFDLSIGSNIYFDDDAADGQVMRVEGNVNVHSIYFQTLEIEPTTYGLEQVAAVSNVLPQTIEFSNVTTAFVTDRKIGIGTEPDTDVGLSGAHVYGHLRLGGASGLQDNDQLKIMTTGGLTVAANDADGQYDYSNLILRAGDSNSSQIFVCGAYTDADRQKIVFQTKNTDRMTILSDGVVNVASNVEASFFIGNGSALTGLVTDFQSVSEGGNTTDQTIIFENPDVSINAYGNVEAQFFIGNGSQLEGLVTDLQSVTEGGNTTNQSIVFSNVDMGANISTNLFVGDTIFVDDVTLSAAPTYNLQQVTGYGASTNEDIYLQSTTASTSRSTGALRVAGGVGVLGNVYATNVYTNVYSEFSNISHLVTGNLETPQLTVNAVAVQLTLGLEQVCNSDNELLNNTMVISNLTPATSATTGALTVSGGVGVSGNLFVGSMPVAQTASNLVTWDSATKQFNDSGGLFSNKLAVVSQQPVAALTGASTVVTDHGTYVASASSGTAYDAFDRDDFSYWLSGTGYTGTSNAYVGATQLATGLPVGEWLRVKMPYKVTVRHLVFTEGYNGASLPLEANVYATNDEGQSWTLVKELTNITAVTPHVVDATASYAEYALVVTKVAGNYDKTSIAEWKLFCESFTVKDGLINMSKIGATSVSGNASVGGEMTVSGNASVGGGSLELTQVSNLFQIKSSSNVVTEFKRSKKLIKYPRVYMTTGTTSGYTASASSEYSGRVAWEQFDSNPIGSSWETADGTFDSSGDDVSGTTFTVNGVSYTGHWAKLQLPERVVFHEMLINAYNNDTAGTDDRRPKKGVVLGSNDNSTWELIHRFNDDMAWSDLTTNQDYTRIVFSGHTQTAYEYVLFLVEQKYGTTTRIAIYNMEFYGIPEYDPEAHGTDTIMRSVPNVPNTDFLAVYYDGRDYTSMPSSVTDKSGNGVTGTPSGVTFDSTWKAFSFDGVNDYISNTQTGYSQSSVYSVATWVRYDSLNSSDPCIFQYGNGSNDSGFGLIGQASEKRIRAFYYGNNAVDVNHVIKLNKWVHLAAIYTTGNGQIHLYIDGQLIGSQTSGTSVTLDSTPHLSIGVQTDSSDVAINNTYFEGLIANFRLFNRALSSEEIWQLYAYQKDYFQVSPDVLTFKGGRLGIGTTEPTAALDVLGSVRMPGFSKVSAGGGYVYTNSRYVVHKFTTSGTFTILEPGLIEYIIVGGGGGGGSRHSGGGGGGGVLVGTIYASKGDYVVTIGTGGSGNAGGSTNGPGNHGNPTRFAGLVALGGGGGGNDGNSHVYIGCSGGTNVNVGAYAAQGYGIQGHIGGLGNSGPSQEGSYAGGGGGGAGGGGEDASPRGNVNNTSGGNGGPGRHIYGLGANDADVYLGGGGGGDCAGVSNGNAGTGGIGGGGDGSKGVNQAGHGEANTGGGGGGAGFQNNLSPANGTGGNGGSGVVYVRYLK